MQPTAGEADLSRATPGAEGEARGSVGWLQRAVCPGAVAAESSLFGRALLSIGGGY